MTTRPVFSRHHDGARSAMRGLLRVALMTLCLAQAWAIVFVLRIGPVLATVDAERAMGVHAGDLLALPLVVMAVAVGSSALAPRRARDAPAVAWDGPLAGAH